MLPFFPLHGMTPKQTERLKKKIVAVKRALAAEKRKFGGYDDSRGLRYLPTKYYVQIEDYSGGLAYTKWFSKNFPDDVGFPDFLFEWTIILYKKGKLLAAGQKAFQTFCANTYLFDKFFGRSVTPPDKWEGSNLGTVSFTDYFNYSNQQKELEDFATWLSSLISTERFIELSDQYIEINKRLKTETDRETRYYLVLRASQLKDSF